jgi:hypothetical protein
MLLCVLLVRLLMHAIRPLRLLLLTHTCSRK